MLGNQALADTVDTDWIHDSVETIGIIYDRAVGLGYYTDYALACDAFPNPDFVPATPPGDDPGVLRRRQRRSDPRMREAAAVTETGSGPLLLTRVVPRRTSELAAPSQRRRAGPTAWVRRASEGSTSLPGRAGSSWPEPGLSGPELRR